MGPSAAHERRFGFWAWEAAKVPGWSGFPVSIPFEMCSDAIASSEATGMRIRRSGAGMALLKPVSVPHQVSRLSATICWAVDDTTW